MSDMVKLDKKKTYLTRNASARLPGTYIVGKSAPPKNVSLGEKPQSRRYRQEIGGEDTQDPESWP